MSKYSKFIAWSTANSQHKKAVFSETVDKDGSWAEMNADMEAGKIDSKGVASAALAIAYADHITAELISDHDALKKDHKLLGHKLVCCHVAANHPDPMLSKTGAYIEKWDSQSAEAVRALRDERDALQAELAALKAERDQLSKACDQRAAHEYKLMGEVAALKAAQEWRGMESAPEKDRFLIGVWEGEWREPKKHFKVYEARRDSMTGIVSWDKSAWSYRTDEGGSFSVFGWLPFPHPTTGAKP